jgi:hypothetical protein
MRPRSIAAFERLFLASIAVGVVQAVLGWEELLRRAAEEGRGGAGVLALLGLTFFVMGASALLVSRGRMASAKWALVILCALGLPLFFGSLGRGTVVGWLPLALGQAALQVVSLGLLFTREAREWLAGSEREF